VNKEFVSYELSKELKELGFDEPCFGFYFTSLDRKTGEPITDVVIAETKKQVHYGDMECSAPLWQQAFRWFKDKHNYMHQIIDVEVSTNTIKGYRFKFGIWKLNDIDIPNFYYMDDSPLGYLTYEEAELECLKKMIKILKNIIK
jgi:hypothetical protein